MTITADVSSPETEALEHAVKACSHLHSAVDLYQGSLPLMEEVFDQKNSETLTKALAAHVAVMGQALLALNAVLDMFLLPSDDADDVHDSG